MLRSPCVIVSDLHIGVADSDVERTFRTFQWVPGHASSLVINGDLLEFWFEWRHVMPRTGFRTLARLADLAESGIDIVWVAGNHDWWGGDVLREGLGVRFATDVWEGPLAGWRARVEHGDGLRRAEDRRYRLLRTLIRHPLAVRAMRVLHPDLGIAIARRSSHTSRTYGARDGGAGLRAVAMQALSADGAPDLLVYGHTHVPALERGPGGRVYANAGSWLAQPTFLLVTPGDITLSRWLSSAQSERLNVLERRTEEALPNRQELLRRV